MKLNSNIVEGDTLAYVTPQSKVEILYEPGCGYIIKKRGDAPAPETNSTKAESPGLKYDAGKPPMSLIDPYAERELAKVLEHGRLKYAAWNWREGIQWSRIIDSAMRHLNAFNDGEDIDPESGLSHLAHAMCNCMFLLRYTQERRELDDRYKEATSDPR